MAVRVRNWVKFRVVGYGLYLVRVRDCIMIRVWVRFRCRVMG